MICCSALGGWSSRSMAARVSCADKGRKIARAGGDFLGGAGGRVGRFFEGLAIPMGELGAGFVSGLAKVEERGAGR